MQPIGPSTSLNLPPGDRSAPTAGKPLRWDPSRLTSVTVKSESVADHDQTLLVAALEDLERKRLAFETLQQADLFHYALDGQ